MLQVQSQRLQPLTTAHLAQTMSLLVLNHQELRERVMQELNDNPALELLDDRVCPTCHRRLAHPGPCPICSLQNMDEGPIVFTSPRDSYRSSTGGGGKRTWDDEPPDREPAAPEDLAIYVLQQLASEIKGDDRPLAAYVLASLDDDGFLQDPPAMIARATRLPLDRVQRVIDRIAHIDPPGLATAGPREALLAQLDNMQEVPLARLARRMLAECFEWVGRHEFDRIADQLEVQESKVRRALAYIQDNLNPYPRRGHWAASPQGAGPGDPNVYHQPDVQISQNNSNPDGPLMVEIFAPVSGWLRISPAFQAALQGADVPKEWKEQFDKASLFVKCIQQRNNTMRQLMRILVKTQRGFILSGDRHLIPMTRAEIADQIGVHESTISRAVSDKSVALPDRRIIPLATFFDRSLPARDCLKEIVHNEVEPLTDEQIADELHEYGVDIARRTVAKYRAMENILPARLRAKQKEPASAPAMAGV
jgi:RNA polymerase sigma-54 factor